MIKCDLRATERKPRPNNALSGTAQSSISDIVHIDDVTDNYFGASSYIEPAPMLTLYVPLIVVNEDEHRRDKFPEKILIEGTEEESISFHSKPALVPVNYGQCCLWSKEIMATCGTSPYHCAQSTENLYQCLRILNQLLVSLNLRRAPLCFIEDTRVTMNRILAEANLSPIRSQTRMALQRQSKSGIRRLLSKLSRGAHSSQGTYGFTTLRMDNGENVELSKQILRSQKAHAIVNYKNSLKHTQQRVFAGLDEFVVDGVEAWSCLSNIVNGMPVPQVDRKRLLKQIDLAEQYQKVINSDRCSNKSDCITDCTTFGLSDPKCPEHQSKCTQAHTSDCPNCINISRTLDVIGEMIKKISNEEFKRESKYDFDNSSEHIIEWSRHNIRSARGNEAKNQTIAQMGDDEAFCTFDWGQKILPQEFREKQSIYFGKKGMPVLVGSFV
ncbi:unnamed protein product [Rotaria socialis]